MSKTVLISAGHSASDPGAVAGNHVEAKLALKMRDKVAAILRARGVSVLEDGADGINEPLTKAISLCRSVPGRAVELHFNAGPTTATGVEALSLAKYKTFSQKLAQAVSSAAGIKLRGESGWKDQSSGQHHRLGFCIAGGVVLELCFISNPSDMKAYLQNEEKVAAALADVLQATSV